MLRCYALCDSIGEWRRTARLARVGIPRTQASPRPALAALSLLLLNIWTQIFSHHKMFSNRSITVLVSNPSHSVFKGTKLLNIWGNSLVVNSPSWRISAVRIFGCDNRPGARPDRGESRPITARHGVTWPGSWPITGRHLVTWGGGRRGQPVSNDESSLCSDRSVTAWR